MYGDPDRPITRVDVIRNGKIDMIHVWVGDKCSGILEVVGGVGPFVASQMFGDDHDSSVRGGPNMMTIWHAGHDDRLLLQFPDFAECGECDKGIKHVDGRCQDCGSPGWLPNR